MSAIARLMSAATDQRSFRIDRATMRYASPVAPQDIPVALDEARDEGKRQMLWLMTVGAEMERWRSQCSEGSFAECWYWWVRDSALRALASLGDEQARRILEEA